MKREVREKTGLTVEDLDSHPGRSTAPPAAELTAPFFYRRLIAHRRIPASMAQAVVGQTLSHR